MTKELGGDRMTLSRRSFALGCAVLGFGAGRARAQAFPTRPIRIIVPFSPGGGSDILARAVAERMMPALGQPVLVENRAGGNTVPGTDAVARADPDGHTILLQTNSFTANSALYATLPYDTFSDFTAVSLVASNPHILVVPASLPVRNLSEFVALAKARPGELSFGTAGIGSVNHLAAEAFQLVTGTQLLHVPYRGSGALIPDLLAGRLASHFAALPVVSGHMRAGGLRALGLTTADRHASWPDLPTLVEQGLTGYDDFRSWFGLLAPARASTQVVSRLAEVAVSAARQPEVRARLVDYEIHASTPQEFDAFLRKDAETVARLARALRITLE
jgi:tripartite-type tricarboxylate transporter receptor subunit TctC